MDSSSLEMIRQHLLDDVVFMENYCSSSLSSETSSTLYSQTSLNSESLESLTSEIKLESNFSFYPDFINTTQSSNLESASCLFDNSTIEFQAKPQKKRSFNDRKPSLNISIPSVKKTEEPKTGEVKTGEPKTGEVKTEYSASENVSNFKQENHEIEKKVVRLNLNLNTNSCGKRVRGEMENDDGVVVKKEVKREQMVATPLTPSNWSSIWDSGNGKGIFEVPPLSPLSPHPNFGYSQLLVS
ncbi:hypothetical protein H5410_028896 [Solanum commersonii]|uniref:Uncharacterized protein n=1 Tax=Solanum commersonii TaxID=4109 RepID=A0A9J5Z7H2_SOLCO|nr:hypothetical protein H5410_028896 [Solanum commersonii]